MACYLPQYGDVTMIFGYIRVSTDDQNVFLQQDALTDCDEVFIDKISGSTKSRPELDRLLGKLRQGDTVKVWRLDRLGRSLKNVIALMEDFEQKGINFVSVTEGFDTATPVGKLFYQIVGAFAEFERNVNRERTIAGRAAARARGREGGRKKTLSPQQARRMALEVKGNSEKQISVICREFGISRSTYYRNVHPIVETSTAPK